MKLVVVLALSLCACAAAPASSPLFASVAKLRANGAMRTQVKELADKRATVEEAKAKLDVARWRRELAGDDPVKNLSFDQAFVDPGVVRAYQGANGHFEDE